MSCFLDTCTCEDNQVNISEDIIMPSLHWICVLTLAIICCLTAQPVKRSVASETERMIGDFLEMIKELNCLDAEAVYYTPENVKENCLVSALNCSLKELNVLIEECQPVSDVFKEMSDNLYTSLESIYNKNKSKYSCSKDEFICESTISQKNVTTFLTSLKSLVQQINILEQTRR